MFRACCLTLLLWAGTSLDLQAQAIRPVPVGPLPGTYSDYASGPVRIQLEARAADATPTDAYVQFELVEDTLGATLDATKGLFLWQPTYRDEGRSRTFRVRTVCEGCETGPELTFAIAVADIQTRPQLQRPRLISVAPNQNRTVQLEVLEPSGQPCQILAVTSSVHTVVVSRTSNPLELQINSSTAAAGSGKITVTLRNEADNNQVEVEIPLVIEAIQYPPNFNSNQTTYRTTEGVPLIIEAPATDRNLDPILYGWEEVEAITTGATFALMNPANGTYQFLAPDLGDADLRIARYNLTASDGFVTVSKPITIEVRRAITRETELARREAFLQLVSEYQLLIDSCQATLGATQRMIHRRNWFNKGADIALFTITLGAALATNLAAPGSDLAKASSILGAVGAGLVALIKVNLVTEIGLRNTTEALQTELITAQKRLEILYGGERLGGFVLSKDYTATMDDYRIRLESARTRYYLSHTNAIEEKRISKIVAWRDQWLRSKQPR